MANETERYHLIGQQLNKYGGSFLYLISLYGTVMNIVMFSQRKYNRRACSVYLLAASICDLIHLNFGFATTIIQYGVHYHWMTKSCRIRSYLVYVCMVISGTLTVSANVNQYILSSTKAIRWRYTCRSAGIRWIQFTIGFWILAAVPILFCTEGIDDRSCPDVRRDWPCLLVQIIYTCLFNGFLPPLIVIVFGCLKRKNVHRLRRRTQLKSVPIRRINEQLTSMLILQAIKSIICSIPYITFTCYRMISGQKHISLSHPTIDNLIQPIVRLLFWSNYTSFYIYIYSSDIFRHQYVKTMKRLRCCSRPKHEITSK